MKKTDKKPLENANFADVLGRLAGSMKSKKIRDQLVQYNVEVPEDILVEWKAAVKKSNNHNLRKAVIAMMRDYIKREGRGYE